MFRMSQDVAPRCADYAGACQKMSGFGRHSIEGEAHEALKTQGRLLKDVEVQRAVYVEECRGSDERCHV